jgi:hypothetical protein
VLCWYFIDKAKGTFLRRPCFGPPTTALVCIVSKSHSLAILVLLAEVEVKLRPTVSRPVRLGIWDRDQFFFLLEIFFRQLRVCYFVAPSLTRGRICNLLLLLVLARAVPLDSRTYFIFPILETPPTWWSRSPYLYQKQGGPDISPDTDPPGPATRHVLYIDITVYIYRTAVRLIAQFLHR